MDHDDIDDIDDDTPTPEEQIREVAEHLALIGPEIRGQEGLAASGLATVNAHTRGLPRSYWPSALLGDLDGYDVAGIIARVTEQPERAHLHGYRIDVTWQRKASTYRGQIVAGKAGPTPRRDRELGAAPFRVTLAFDVWVLLTAEERERLVHHELGHCGVTADAEGRPKFVGRAHDVEDFADTIARHGLSGSGQAQAVAEAIAHPETVRRLREYDLDPVTGQGLLFGETASPMARAS